MATSPWIFPAILVLAVLAAYSNSLIGALQFDDLPSITENPSIQRLWPLSGPLSPPSGTGFTVEGRPLLNFSLAINYAISGTDPWSYHVVNLLIHAASALAAFGLVRRTLLAPGLAPRWSTQATPFAFAVAALWSLHPVQTESVTYIVQRAESLAGLFSLLTLYCFVRSTAGARALGWILACVGSCLLGDATKETMVVVPVLALLHDRTFLAGSFRQALKLRWRTYLALGSTWIFLAWLVTRSGTRGGTFLLGDLSAWWQHGLTQFEATVRYLCLSAWPHPLVFDYGIFQVDHASSIWPEVLLVLVLLIATAVAVVRRPIAGYLGSWFFLGLAVTSLLPGPQQIIVEHRLYLALLGPVAALAWLAWNLPSRLRLPACASIAAAFALLVVARNRVYETPLALWSQAVEQRPGNYRAWNNLGQALYTARDFPGALRALAKSTQLEPANPDAQFNLGLTYLALHQPAAAALRFEEAAQLKPRLATALLKQADALLELDRKADAIPPLLRVIELRPDWVDATCRLAALLVESGRPNEATLLYQQALHFQPSYAPAESGLGLALIHQGLTDQGIARLRQALSLQPDLPGGHFNLGLAYSALGQPSLAAAAYTEDLRRFPRHAEGWLNLGILLAQQGDLPHAEDHLRRAVELRPALPESHANLGIVLAGRGQALQAISHYEEAIRLRPHYASARYNLGNALVTLGRYAEARPQFEEAVRLDPSFEPAREMAARLAQLPLR